MIWGMIEERRRRRQDMRPSRTSVWFLVFGCALACLLSVNIRTSAAATAFAGDYYPESVSNNGGQVVTSATVHNVIVNCPNGGCWGMIGSAITPDQIVDDFNASKLSHVIDQYVGSTKSARYSRGTGVHVTYSFTANTAKYLDAQNILDLAVKAVGTKNAGYSHIYVLHIPAGTTVCDSAGSCVGGKTPMCGYHAAVNHTISGVKVHLLMIVLPYENLGNCEVRGGFSPMIDSTANAFVREMADTITDPDGDAWLNTMSLDLFKREVGDQCWEGKDEAPLVFLNRNPYKIQFLYSNASHSCVESP
jgi:hypothetical protein